MTKNGVLGLLTFSCLIFGGISAKVSASPAEPKDALEEAISAVENRDYAKFEELLKELREVDSSSEVECSLFCRLVFVVRDGHDPFQGVDLPAINIALDQGFNPSSYPELPSQLLATVNRLNVESGDLHPNAGRCSPERDELVSTVKRILGAHKRLANHILRTSSGLQATNSFYYTFQVCLKDYACDSAATRSDETFAAVLNGALSSSERVRLISLADAEVIDRKCLEFTNGEIQ